jgi:hypothetical protein
MLPPDGADGLVGVGLGRFFRHPAHAPARHMPVTATVSETTRTTIAGLPIVLAPAPSDADDNLNIFFPTLGLCVNNVVCLLFRSACARDLRRVALEATRWRRVGNVRCGARDQVEWATVRTARHGGSVAKSRYLMRTHRIGARPDRPPATIPLWSRMEW